MVRSGDVSGQAVLRDFPLRLWAQQQQHTEELLREFNLVLLGQESGQSTHAAPGQLVALAEMFTRNFGVLLDQLTQARQAAYDAGADRMDSVVPLPADLPKLLDQVRRVLAVVDEYCSRGELLALQRPSELRAFTDWTMAELVAQQSGADPTPWPGPF
jgi:hypothetical protein